MMSFLFRSCFGLCFALGVICPLHAQSVDTIPGLFSTYRDAERILWEIPGRLWGRDMSLMTTIRTGAARKEKSADAKFGYAGDRFGPCILRFERNGGKVLVKQVAGHADAATGEPYASLFEESEEPLLIKEFDILNETAEGVVIDVAAWLREGELWGLRPFFFLLGIGAEQEAEVTEVVGLPDGVIVRSERVYDGIPRMPGTSANGEITRWQIGCCLRLLPEQPMKVRYASERVGYFSIPHWEVMQGGIALNKTEVVKRWRLEVAPEDTVRYNRGELVEPCRRIVMYVDRRFPEKWWPYILKAVNNWQGVFETCGFKNAIEGRIAPDSLDGLSDHSAYSWIVYKAGPMENAYGRPFIDFRTGEILCCHVAIFHSVFDMLCRWYAAQTGGEPEELSEEALGKLLEMVVTHEVGHTLGLTHNFYGSALYDTTQLKDAVLMRRHRHGSSIMDYMRLNYAAEPEDGLRLEDKIPQIGAYDSLAIEWGYRCFPGCTAEEEKERLSGWVKRKQRERRYRFQDASAVFPEAQAEDLGRYSLEAARIGMRKLWMSGTVEPDGERWGYAAQSVADSRNRAIREQFTEYINQALTYLGGRRKCWEGDSVLWVPLESREQRDALDFLWDNVLRENTVFPLEWREEWVKKTIDGLLGRACHVADCVPSGCGDYSVKEYVENITALLKTLETDGAWERFVLWYYVDGVGTFFENNGHEYPEVAALFYNSLHELASNFRKRKGGYWERWKNNVNLIMDTRW